MQARGQAHGSHSQGLLHAPSGRQQALRLEGEVIAGTCCPRCGGSVFPERVLDSNERENVCLSCSYTVVPGIALPALLELAEELELTSGKATISRKPYRGTEPL